MQFSVGNLLISLWGIGSGSMRGEVALRMEEAEKLIVEAEESLKAGDNERCCISACYAMFHIVRALVLSVDINPKTYEDAVHVLCIGKEDFNLTNDDCARLYRALDIKAEIDGGHLRRVTEEVAKRTLEDAKEVLKKAKDYFSKSE